MRFHRVVSAALTSLAVAVALVPLTAATSTHHPGHLVLKGGRVAACTTGRAGTPVTLSRYRPGNRGEEWDGDHFASAYGAGLFYWAPGGSQTSRYLRVTRAGATLVDGAPHGTVFAPVTFGKYTMLTLLGSHGPTQDVLTDRNGRLVIAREAPWGPAGNQLWLLR